jgi:hypothetical protein
LNYSNSASNFNSTGDNKDDLADDDDIESEHEASQIVWVPDMDVATREKKRIRRQDGAQGRRFHVLRRHGAQQAVLELVPSGVDRVVEWFGQEIVAGVFAKVSDIVWLHCCR